MKKYEDPLEESRMSLKALRYENPMKGMQEALKALRYENPMKGIQEAMKALRYENPMKGMQEAMKALRYENPMKGMQEAMKALRYENPMKGMQEAMKALRYENPMKGMQEAMKALRYENPMKGIQEAMKALQVIDTGLYEEFLSRRIPTNNFEEIFLGVTNRINSAKKDIYVDDVLVAVIEDYTKAINNSPKNVLSLEFYIMLIISLLLHFHSIYNSNQSAESISEQINNLENAVTQQISELSERHESFENDVYYVVDRAVNLRSAPTTKKNNVLTILYPNQKTRLIDQKGKWIKVEYYNFTTNNLEVGWCYKKYLQRIK